MRTGEISIVTVLYKGVFCPHYNEMGLLRTVPKQLLDQKQIRSLEGKKVGIKSVMTIFQTLKLLLPALVPSWRFFDVIAPSPRVEFTLLETPEDVPVTWQEFRPRPAKLSPNDLLKRLFWNPRWNESLFLVSCAERLMANPTEHSRIEIFTRIGAELNQDTTQEGRPPYLQFRLIFLARQGTEIHKRTTYTSPVQRYSEDTIS